MEGGISLKDALVCLDIMTFEFSKLMHNEEMKKLGDATDMAKF